MRNKISTTTYLEQMLISTLYTNKYNVKACIYIRPWRLGEYHCLVLFYFNKVEFNDVKMNKTNMGLLLWDILEWDAGFEF